MKRREELEEIIGYHFKKDALLRQALTHSSYANEKNMKKGGDNERLEFLGDAVLEVVTSDYLFHAHKHDPEGDLTKLRASIVCEQTLAMCAKEIELGEYLFLGKGEGLTGGRNRKSVTSDAMEAVIGAIYLDGGFGAAREFIHKFILTDIDNKKLFHDSKTILQEYVQGECDKQLHYEVVNVVGPDHAKEFTVEAYIGDELVGRGISTTKKQAEQEAAYHALLDINKKKAHKE